MDSLIKLTNLPFQLEFNGKEYTVKKATLQQVAQYYSKIQEISKQEGSSDIENGAKGIVYALYLILHNSDETITEDYINENLPNVNPNELLTQLGFLVPAPKVTT